MEFTRYSSLTNYTAGKANKMGLLQDEFIATEKIHGANFSFVTDGKDVRIASRNKLLTSADAFHNHERLIEQHRDRILAIAQTFPSTTLKQLTIFGEIFGGLYPHVDVAPTAKVKHVQKGVFYAPGLHFRIFDMHVQCMDGSGCYLNFDVMIRHCVTVSLPVVPILCRGSMKYCLSIDVEALDSTIPAELGLPKLESLSNLAEGIVIRPVVEHVLKNGKRAILKRKANRFEEVVKDPSKQADDLIEGEDWTELAVAYVTENRLRNVLSKETTAFEHKGKVMSLMSVFVEDAITDFKKDHVEFRTITGSRQRDVSQAVTSACRELLLGHADAIVSGSF